MLDKLSDISTSAVKKLVKIKQDQDRLQIYLDKTSELQDKVNEAVYEKVVGDYNSRHAVLEEEAVPLKVEVRSEYAKLSKVLDELQQVVDSALMNKEELELRHSAGELSKKQLGEKLKEAEAALTKCQKDLSEADQLKKDFTKAFRSEEELEKPFRNPSTRTPSEEEGEVLNNSGEVARPANVEDPDISQHSKSALIGEGSFSDPPDADTLENTFVVPRATLATTDSSYPQEEFNLGILNYIGRTDDNQILISAPGVSRKHALVTAGPDGFTVKDLDSHNGTFVNDERVEEKSLNDGDRIQIGNVQLVFHMG